MFQARFESAELAQYIKDRGGVLSVSLQTILEG